jgi:hypothetical protein
MKITRLKSLVLAVPLLVAATFSSGCLPSGSSYNNPYYPSPCNREQLPLNPAQRDMYEAQQRREYQRTYKNPDYARFVGPNSSMQERIDAQTEGADLNDPYDRAEVDKIKQREMEAEWKRRVIEMSRRNGTTPHFKQYGDPYHK